MANLNNYVIQDPNIDLNMYVNRYTDDANSNDNPLTLLNIDSQYLDLEQLCSFLQNSDNENTAYDYTSLHLNIQSLPAKFETLKL